MCSRLIMEAGFSRNNLYNVITVPNNIEQKETPEMLKSAVSGVFDSEQDVTMLQIHLFARILRMKRMTDI